MTSGTEILDENTVIINDQGLQKFIRETAEVPPTVNTIHLAIPQDNEVTKAVDKVVGGIKITRREGIKIKRPIDEYIEQYKFDFTNPEKTSAEFKVSSDIARILYVSLGFNSPDEWNRFNFETQEIKFSAYLCFGRRNAYKKDKIYFDTVKLKSIDAPENSRTKQKIFQAIFSSFKLNKLRNMFRFLCMGNEYPVGVNEEFLEVTESGVISQDFNDELKLELCRSDLEPLPDVLYFTENEIQLSFPQAVFMIEGLALNQSDDEEGYVEKKFTEKKTVYRLLLPAMLPVAFECRQEGIFASFTDYCDISAQQICDRFQTILKNLKANCLSKIYVASFQEVLYNIIKQKDILPLNNKEDFIAVISKQKMLQEQKFEESSQKIIAKRLEKKIENRTDGLTNFGVYIYYLSPTPQERSKITERFENIMDEIYEKCAYYECPICNLQSCHYAHSCPLGLHSGGRVSFKNSKGEEVMEETVPGMLDGKAATRICYECCGTVIEETDTGCQKTEKHTMPNHDEDMDEDYHIWSNYACNESDF